MHELLNTGSKPGEPPIELYVKQQHELAEFFGFETRNKYAVQTKQGHAVAFIAEQQKGLFGFLFRQWLGHWRRFTLSVFDNNRQLCFTVKHPFRFFFTRLEVYDTQNVFVGAIQKRFSIFTKSFDLEDPRGSVLLEVRSGFFNIWTFKFKRRDREVARIEKKWGGLLTELFTDKDSFKISFQDPELSTVEKTLILIASIYVDLVYFELHANKKRDSD